MRTRCDIARPVTAAASARRPRRAARRARTCAIRRCSSPKWRGRGVVHRPRHVVELDGRGEDRAAAGQPGFIEPRDPALEEHAQARAAVFDRRAAARSTSARKRSAARSSVSTCSASFEWKCANSPLFDRPSRSASGPMVSPPSPARSRDRPPRRGCASACGRLWRVQSWARNSTVVRFGKGGCGGVRIRDWPAHG